MARNALLRTVGPRHAPMASPRGMRRLLPRVQEQGQKILVALVLVSASIYLSTGVLSGEVVYLLVADKYLGPLASRLSGVSQPVISTRSVFSTLLPSLLADI